MGFQRRRAGDVEPRRGCQANQLTDALSSKNQEINAMRTFGSYPLLEVTLGDDYVATVKLANGENNFFN